MKYKKHAHRDGRSEGWGGEVCSGVWRCVVGCGGGVEVCSGVWRWCSGVWRRVEVV